MCWAFRGGLRGARSAAAATARLLGWFKVLNLVPATDALGHVYRPPYVHTARYRSRNHANDTGVDLGNRQTAAQRVTGPPDTPGPGHVRAPGPGGQTGPSLPYGGLAVAGLGVAAVAI